MAKKKKKKKFSKLRTFLKLIIAIILLSILLYVGLVLYFGSKTIEVTDENFWAYNEESQLYEENITWVSVEDVSEYYIVCLLATEDRKFLDHNGVSIIELIKATLKTVFADSPQGGSTITMQLAKQLYIDYWQSNDRYDIAVEYKFTQISYAYKIERKYEKDEILENYINSIYFGNGQYGIENASQFYYGKSSSDLLIYEAAMLAGITQLPAIYDPYLNPEGTQSRRNEVIYMIYDLDYITYDEYIELIGIPITTGLVEY